MSKSPKLYQNPLSRFAGVMAIMVFIILAFLLLLDYLGIRLNPIIGMLAYTLFPALLLFYLFLIPVGMYREWRRRHKQVGIEPPAFPRFDFNQKNQRVQLYVFILGTSLVGLLVLGVSFRAYEFTESVHFCSELCHKVMEPEATTYKSSPHARVECVQCHVGKGATWYVKSKLAGLYQVYATLFKKYPTPIETPIHNLRPSADTCEQCHWPSKFFGAKQVMRIHYEDDEKNTPRQFFMLVNVGGGISPTGIHWHVGQDEVYYVARDKGRQDIPWVKVKHKDGRETTYVSSENPPTGDDIAKGELRRMDCIDCHNRPTHIFRSPRHAIDESITAGSIDRSLPYVKKIGVEVLSKEYDSNDKAHIGIRDGIFSFYKEKYPDIAASKIGLIEKTVGEVQRIWDVNNFTHMKSKWSIYPNNIGHLIWPGCFRCHDGLHMNEKGEPIKKECNTCHLFLSEKLSGVLSAQTALGKPFEHPVDVGGEEMRSSCITCHR
jgi:nitrate/TMAO reductase-like tetraheme cytochrome c subunit